MTEDPRTGYLVTGPSISPENGYISPSGNHLSLSMMPAIDREVVYDIYNACIKSSKILGVANKFLDHSVSSQSGDAVCSSRLRRDAAANSGVDSTEI